MLSKKLLPTSSTENLVLQQIKFYNKLKIVKKNCIFRTILICLISFLYVYVLFSGLCPMLCRPSGIVKVCPEYFFREIKRTGRANQPFLVS